MTFDLMELACNVARDVANRNNAKILEAQNYSRQPPRLPSRASLARSDFNKVV
jgi:hypothetical protein